MSSGRDIHKEQRRKRRGYHYLCAGWHILSAFVLLLCVLVGVAESRVRIVNGTYQGIVVALAPDIGQEEGLLLIDSIKVLFTRAALVLHKAMYNTASFGLMTILVPRFWNESSLWPDSNATHQLGLAEAHVRVDAPNPQHDHQPYTQQPRGCGQAGLFIHLTPLFLRGVNRSEETLAEAARVFVHNWARFRYGVFPETWKLDRPQFLPIYQTESSLQPTGCSNVQLKGNWSGKCELDWLNPRASKEPCIFTPFQKQHQSLMSSLMSWPRLPQVNFFCDNYSHNALAPTVHNSLCQSRNVWDIIMDHPDFRLNPKIHSKAADVNPTFRILRDQQPSRFILLVDTSSHINRTGHLDSAFVALTRLVMRYLPNDTEVLVMHYTDAVRNATEFVRLDTNTNRHVVRRGIAVWHSASAHAFVFDALRHTLKNFFVDEGAICVVLSSAIGDKNISEAKLDEVEFLLEQKSVRLVTIVLNADLERTRDTTEALMGLANFTGGLRLVVSKETEHVTALAQLDAIMLSAAGLADRRLVQVKHDTLSSDQASGTFITDDVNSDVVFSVTFPREHPLWPVKLFSPAGKVYDGTHSSYHDDKDMQQVFITIHKAKPGNWQYAINIGESHSHRMTVTVTAQTTSVVPITLRGWIDVRQEDKASWPVVLYAEVLQGSSPIMAAHVQAIVVSDNTQHVTLIDLGNGDADITRNDGIYSRYVPGCFSKGYYTVTLTADDNGTAYMFERNGDELVERPTRLFQRSLSLGTFFVGHSMDTSPPSRIADLHPIAAQHNRLTLAWTEPGDDFDTGTVASYQFWWSEKMESLMAFDLSCVQHLVPEQPIHPSGASFSQTAVLVLPPLRSRVVYIAITAEDLAKNRSPLSNVVTVLWNQVQPGLDAFEGHYHTASQRSSIFYRSSCGRRCLSKAAIGVVIVCAVAITLVVGSVLVFTYIWARQLRRRQHNSILGDDGSQAGSESDSPGQERTNLGFRDPVDVETARKEQAKEPTKEIKSSQSLPSSERILRPQSKGTPILIHRQPLFKRVSSIHDPQCPVSHSDVIKCACSCPPLPPNKKPLPFSAAC